MMGTGFGEEIGRRLVWALLIAGAIVLVVGIAAGALVARLIS